MCLRDLGLGRIGQEVKESIKIYDDTHGSNTPNAKSIIIKGINLGFGCTHFRFLASEF